MHHLWKSPLNHAAQPSEKSEKRCVIWRVNNSHTSMSQSTLAIEVKNTKW